MESIQKQKTAYITNKKRKSKNESQMFFNNFRYFITIYLNNFLLSPIMNVVTTECNVFHKSNKAKNNEYYYN